MTYRNRQVLLRFKFYSITVFLIFGFLKVPAVSAQVHSADAMKVEPLIRWVKDNVSSISGFPLSFGVHPDKRMAVLQSIGEADSVTGIIERIIVEEGMSIYDAALWQIVLASLGSAQDLQRASMPIETYVTGGFRSLHNIRAGNGGGQRFIYNRKYPEVISSNLKEVGKRGFLFRILNAHGNYLSPDPLDGKVQFEDFPNWPDIHWEDWKPIAGENAWVVIAAMHLYHQKYYDFDTGEYSHQEDALELTLASELARAAIFLQAENGAVRMAPIGTYYFSLDDIKASDANQVAQELDAAAIKSKESYSEYVKEYGVDGALLNSEHTTWYYNEISTENNLSWYTAFRLLHQVTQDPVYLNAMGRIEEYLKWVWNDEENYFYQGAHFDGVQWTPNTRHFATDVQTWGISKLGPQQIDQWFGEGSAYQMWQTSKDYSGVYDDDQQLIGVGYTKEENQVSVEWTVGALFAMQELAEYYQSSNLPWSEEVSRDAQQMRLGVESYRQAIGAKQAAYSYSSTRRWIPFGWFAHDADVLSMVSTCWIILHDTGFNPFHLNSTESF